MDTIAAVLRTSDGAQELEPVRLRDLDPHEVLVRIAGVGLCHTDVLPRSPEFGEQLPLILGHEGAGVVTAVGEAVDEIRVDDHVVLSFDSCGSCDSCRRNLPSYCASFFPLNLTGREIEGRATATDNSGLSVGARWFGQSSFAHHAIANERNAIVVDRALPIEMLGPLGCGIQTGAGSVLVQMNVQPGSSVAVFGAGAVGLAAVMAAKVAGAGTIIAVDLHAHRLELASELGATHVFEGTHDDLRSEIMRIVAAGVEHTLDTTGVPPVMLTALDVTALGGTCGYVGVQTGDLVLGNTSVVGKTIMGILEGGADPKTFIPTMLRLWQDGVFPFDRLITTFPLSALGEAEKASLDGRVIKPVLLPPSE